MDFVPRPISFVFEFYEMDDPPLLPTRVERARPIPICSPRPTLPPHSFMAILQGDWQDDWESTWAVRTHTNTNEEEVIELSQDFLLATTVNSTRVDSRKVCYLPKKKKRATHSSTVIQFDVETEGAPGCVKTCVFEGKQMEWRRQWRAFIHRRTQRHLQARDDLR
ncbi:hypothetical protein B0H21DRAFT_827697 [Amylocystis lapponica]|nr:hypothetical protein B0H21DRAFT_827697 [Amylocystis lapponica]